MTYKTIAIIVAAGEGKRFGGDVPKQYQHLAGKPILYRTLQAFLQHQAIDAVQVVYNPEFADLYEGVANLVSESSFWRKILPPVPGGKRRMDSVRLGLEEIGKYNPWKVLIHDAARSLIDNATIDRVIADIDKYGSAIPAIALEDSLKKVDSNKIQATFPRDNLYRVQTPQGFLYDNILKLHQKYADSSIELTDDAALYEKEGLDVYITEGSRYNIKITSQNDMEFAEDLWKIMKQGWE